jgi:molybdenum cofactor cytidylyltransferase
VTAPDCAALILAAGLGSRFGGRKLLAKLHGRPLLQHVLDTVAEAKLAPVVVVVDGEAAELARGIAWRDELRVANPDPARGLASSLALGIAALEGTASPPRRVLVLLGDQPLTSAGVIARLRAEPHDDERPIAVPRYADGRPGNPVLLERVAWPLAAHLAGDRGMSQLFESRPGLLRHVDVPGHNPDVDTVDDLERLNRGEGRGRSFRTVAADRSRPVRARPRRT